MLHAAVHSMYSRVGSAPALTSRTGGASSGCSGSLSGQSPQKVEPPLLRSCLNATTGGPCQIAFKVWCRTSPSTRFAYGSAQPQTTRPSHSMTAIDQGQEQV